MTIDITTSDSEAMDAFIKTVCKDIGPRAPCTASEAKAAEFIKAEMQKTCSEVAIEPFTCAPWGLLCWIQIVIVLVAISFILYLIAPYALPGVAGVALCSVSIALVVSGWLVTWKQFFSYEEFIDRFLKQAQSQNVVGRILPASEVKRVIAFSGHHDSAPRYNLLEYLGGGGYAAFILWGFVIFGIWTITIIIATIIAIGGGNQDSIYTFSIWLLVVGLPALVVLWFFKTSGARGNVVPGAVDNLSAVAVVLGVGKYVKAHPGIVPAGTEIRLISFGCEEAGLRGAYRYVEAHREELGRTDFQLVNMDGLQSPKSLMVLAFEPTTRTPHDPRVTAAVTAAAEKAGIPFRALGVSALDRVAGFFSGGTDAAAFSKAGIPATSIMAINIGTYLNNYHTSRDTPDRIEPGVLEGALKICLTYLEKEGEK